MGNVEYPAGLDGIVEPGAEGSQIGSFTPTQETPDKVSFEVSAAAHAGSATIVGSDGIDLLVTLDSTAKPAFPVTVAPDVVETGATAEVRRTVVRSRARSSERPWQTSDTTTPAEVTA